MTRQDLNEGWTPDTIAECCEVSKELQSRLWSFVQEPKVFEEVPEWPRCKYKWTHFLTDSEFKECVKAVEAY